MGLFMVYAVILAAAAGYMAVRIMKASFGGRGRRPDYLKNIKKKERLERLKKLYGRILNKIFKKGNN